MEYNDKNLISENELDEKLSSSEHLAVRSWIAELEQDSPSLAWRSELNQKLMLESKARDAKRRLGLRLVPAFGLACAAVFGLMMIRPQQAGISAPVAKPVPVESVLASAHIDALAALGVSANPVAYPLETASETLPGFEWSESDLDTL